MTDQRPETRESDAASANTAAESAVDNLFAGAGEMSALMRSTDWAQTKLGPVEGWPRSLRTMLGVVLGSRFPMLLWWGPDLLHLYNDAYRPILRDKHPASLAAPAAQVWAEIWDVAGPLAKSVQEGGPATWLEDLQLFISSGGMAEETYFTFSYSPVPGDDGRIGGILNTVQETTAKVQGERQIRMLRDLGARGPEARTESEAYRIAAETLAANELDIPFVLFYALNEKADEARLAGAGGWSHYEGPAMPALIPLAGGEHRGGWPVAEVIRSGHEAVVDDLSERFGPLPAGRWNGVPERAIVLPLARAGEPPCAVLIAGISPHRAFNDRYLRLFRDAAGQAMTVIASASAREADQKRAEALAEIDRAKTAFFNNVSHEFRTPLTLMLGPLEDSLNDTLDPLSAQQKIRVELAHNNALRLLKLVNTLLDFSSIEAGRLRASYAPVDIALLTGEIVAMFQSAADKAGIRLVCDCPRQSEPAWVDRDLWEKVVANLVSNALKFTHNGEIAVRVRREATGFTIEVADSGVGIPESELPRIFERFYRVSGTTGRTLEGTGIGLALTRELVDLHGGRITVASAVGRGTTFRIEMPRGFAHLPAESVSDKPADPSIHRNSRFHAAEAARWGPGSPSIAREPDEIRTENGARGRVLVVDDNADLREYLAGLLSPIYEVSVANNGLAALAEIEERPPDIVVSDVMMPQLDGLGLVRELRKNPITAALPVILLSARAGEESAIDGLDAGSDDYLVKPFSARELLARVRTHIELARTRREWIMKLKRSNRELDAFSYSVSHDLRAPLRAIDGFSQLLAANYRAVLDERGQRYLDHIGAGVKQMTALIEALLELARIGRAPIKMESVNLSAIAATVVANLRHAHPDRKVAVDIADGLVGSGDPRLLTVVLVNLIGNAWKFTAKTADARIQFGRLDADELPFFVRDNGAGFDTAYAERLFAPFQRLHRAEDFDGTGVGLATVERVLSRHGGRIWVEAAIDEGATFFFSLPDASG